MMARSGRTPRLVQAVREFVDSDSWAAAKVVVEREPGLLTDAADDVLVDLFAQARRQNDEPAARGFAEHRECLRLIRADGLVRLDEMIGAGVPEQLRERWVEAELTYERYRFEPTRKRLDAVLGMVDGILTDPMFPEVGADRRSGLAQAAAGVAMARYLVVDDGADLNHAVELYRLSLSQMSNADPDRSAAASALGSALCMRYERLGAPDDLDEGIDWTRRAATDAPPAERWLVLHNLAANLGMRYELLGEPDDLADALDAVRAALAAEPPAVAAPQLVHTSADLLIIRFERDGGLDDLEAAAEMVERVMPVATTAEERAPLRVTLATITELRFQLDGDVSRLDRAVGQLRLALREFGRRSAQRPLCLQHLGSTLLTRFSATDDPVALRDALDALREADASVPATGPRAALFSTLLGLAELRAAVSGVPVRARRRRPRSDPLSAAVDRLRTAVSVAAGSPRLLPFTLINLGTGLSARHGRDHRPADLDSGTEAYRTAVERAATEDPHLALRGAVEWGDWATARVDWVEADAAYRSAIDAIDRLRRHQLLRGHKEVWIALGGGLAEKATSAAVRARRPREAVIHLERCRAQLLGERLSTTRLDLTRLDDLAPALALRYRTAAERVRGLEAQSAPTVSRLSGTGFTAIGTKG